MTFFAHGMSLSANYYSNFRTVIVCIVAFAVSFLTFALIDWVLNTRRRLNDLKKENEAFRSYLSKNTIHINELNARKMKE